MISLKKKKKNKKHMYSYHCFVYNSYADYASIINNSKFIKEGFSFYIKSITTPYVLSALKVTIIATVAAVVINTLFGIIAAWLLTRFDFKGKQVLQHLLIYHFLYHRLL